MVLLLVGDALALLPATTTTTIPLDTAIEVNLLARGEPPIATITWFNIPDKNGMQENVVETLRDRTKSLLQHNPWLTGRIVGGNPLSILLQKPPRLEFVHCQERQGNSDEQLEKVFQHARVKESIVSPTTPLSDLFQSTFAFTALNGSSGHLCRVAVVESGPSLAVIFSLSHGVADIRAYYALLGMLLSDHKAPYALDLESIPNEDSLVREAFGSSAFDLQHHVLANVVKGARGLLERFVFNRTGREQWFLVNDDVMADEKLAIQSNLASVSGVSFVSTNDVLTSWFFRKSTASLGLMCVDYRDTVLSHYSDKGSTAGTIGRNRWGTIVYPVHSDAVEPWTIRRSLVWLKHGEEELERNFGSKLPSAWQFATGDSTLAVASSWAQDERIEKLRLGDTPAILHLPCYDFSTYAPSGYCVMRTFTPRPGLTGVYIAGDSRMVDALLDCDDSPRFLKPIELSDMV